jgi:hypothetical protein
MSLVLNDFIYTFNDVYRDFIFNTMVYLMLEVLMGFFPFLLGDKGYPLIFWTTTPF